MHSNYRHGGNSIMHMTIAIISIPVGMVFEAMFMCANFIS